MENPFYKSYQEVELRKSIDERKKIIDFYLETHYINRDHAIQKIIELRKQDLEIYTATIIYQTGQPTIPMDQCSDLQLACELNDQVKMLEGKLAKNTVEHTKDILLAQQNH